jgi:hypothetical protein
VEHRVSRLEEHVGDLRAVSATHGSKLAHQQTAIQELTEAVKELTAVLNKSRGALWVIGVSSATFGAIAGWFSSVFHSWTPRP